MTAPVPPVEPRPTFLPGPATGRTLPLPTLLSLAARRRGGRRAVSAVVVVLFVAAVGLFAAPAITDVIAKIRQHQLVSTFDNPRLKTLFRSGNVPIGSDLTQLVVDNDRVQISVLVVEGTTTAALDNGAGHYRSTPLPCYQGNVGIAGHRTTYGRPFNKLDEMEPGDTVMLHTPIGDCTYRVVPAADIPAGNNPWIVQPDDFGVVSQRGALGTGHWLTLTSCNPPGSATQRIVLRLQMVSSTVHEPASALAGRHA
jgi:sortase A